MTHEPIVGKYPSSRWRPVWNCSCAPWLLSSVHIERTRHRSSACCADVREPVADLEAALAVLLVADLQRIDRVADQTVRIRARRSARSRDTAT